MPNIFSTVFKGKVEILFYTRGFAMATRRKSRFMTATLHIFPLSILLLSTIRGKLLGPHTGLQIGKCRAFAAATRRNSRVATANLYIFPVYPTTRHLRAKQLGYQNGLQVGKCRGFA